MYRARAAILVRTRLQLSRPRARSLPCTVLQPPMHGVAASHAWCCSLPCTVLQPPMHGVAASHARCCSLPCTVLQPPMHGIAASNARGRGLRGSEVRLERDELRVCTLQLCPALVARRAQHGVARCQAVELRLCVPWAGVERRVGRAASQHSRVGARPDMYGGGKGVVRGW